MSVKIEYPFVIYQCVNRIGTITMNRPDKRNALNAEFVSSLKEAFTHAYNDIDCKIIILKSACDVFCAGADLDYLRILQANTYDENYLDSSHLASLFRLIYTGPKVVIAQVEGHAIAGGCGLAAVCDFTFSLPQVKYAYTEVKIGFVPAIVMIFLIRKIGESNARQLLLGGHEITAIEAKNISLITNVFEPEIFEKSIHDFCENLLLRNSGNSLKIIKEMMAECPSMSLDQALDYAAKKNAEVRASADCMNGIAAFLNKQKITW